MTEILPGDLSEDLVMLAKNGWTVELSYRRYVTQHFKVRATRKSWVIHFKHYEDGGFAEGHLFRNGDASVSRIMTRSQIKRFVGMTDEGREANYGKATI